MCSVEMRKDIVGRWNTMLLAICELVERMKDVLLGCDLALPNHTCYTLEEYG